MGPQRRSAMRMSRNGEGIREDLWEGEEISVEST